MPAHTRVDLACNWRMNNNRLFLSLDNLFDTDYLDAAGFPAAGLSARIGAEFRF